MLSGPILTAVRQQRPLTIDEAAHAAHEVAALYSEIEDLDGQKKQSADTFNQLIGSKKKSITDQIKRIREGEEITVRCETYLNLPTPGMKVLWDPEMLRIIRRETMLDKDRRDANLDFSTPPDELIRQIENELSNGEGK